MKLPRQSKGLQYLSPSAEVNNSASTSDGVKRALSRGPQSRAPVFATASIQRAQRWAAPGQPARVPGSGGGLAFHQKTCSADVLVSLLLSLPPPTTPPLSRVNKALIAEGLAEETHLGRRSPLHVNNAHKGPRGLRASRRDF